MWHFVTDQRPLWLVAGIVLGLGASGLLPRAPLHAVATDRFDTFAICTAPVDDEVEGIFFLDFLTGTLQAAVLSPKGKFSAFYGFNVQDFMKVDASKNPKYLMVSGMSDLRRGTARANFSRAVIYVAEVTTGRVAAFTLPWQKGAIAAGQSVRADMIPVDVHEFRTAAVRPAGTPQQ